jgi:hypothetical protein
MIVFTTYVTSAPFLRGDGNQSGAVDVSDAIGVLLYMFTEESSPPECLDAADANDSGAIDLGDAVWTLNYLFAGGPPPPPPFPLCGDDPTDDDLSCKSFGPHLCGGQGILTGATGCKSFAKEGREGGSSSQDCLAYQYDGTSLLTLKHINAGFNCCPGEIFISVTVQDNVITIQEGETDALCDCLCLFDLDMQIPDLAPGQYLIVVQGMYVHHDTDTWLELVADLSSATSGSHCVERTYYPWGL